MRKKSLLLVLMGLGINTFAISKDFPLSAPKLRYLKSYENGLNLYKGLNQYFEFYNTRRFHQSLDYKTPAEIYYQKAVA